MKRKLCAIFLSLILCLSMLPATALAYNDTEGHWAEGSIDRWSEHGVVQGSNDLFNPDGLLTRGEAAQLFVNLLNLTEMADISMYTDVDPDAWFADAIAKCVAAGIMTGTGNGMDPYGILTREQMFVMLGRALAIQPVDTADVAAPDDEQISSWAVGIINAMRNKGFIKGTPDGSIAPLDNIDRGSMARLLDQTIVVYADKPGEYEAPEGGIVLVLSDGVAITGDADVSIVIVVPDVEVSLEGATGEIEVSVLADDVDVTNAPNGTVIVTGETVTGTTANGSEVAKDSELVIEEKPVTPPAPVYDDTDVHYHEYTTYVSCDGTTHTMRCSCGATQSVPVTPEHVAHIGEAGYETLDEAIEAAEANDIIILSRDISLEHKLVINKDITIDGNGKTITGCENTVYDAATGYDLEAYFEITNGTFTIESAALTGFGKNAQTNSGVAVFKIRDGAAATAKIVARDLTIKDFCRSAFDIRSGSFEITDCNIDCGNGQIDVKLTKAIQAGYGSTAVTGTISGCTITGAGSNYQDWGSAAIEIYDNATVEITDTTITDSQMGICVTSYSLAAVANVDNCNVTAVDALVVDGANATLNVTSGNYTGTVSYKAGQFSFQEDCTFTNATSAIVAAALSAISTPKSTMSVDGNPLKLSFVDDKSNGNYLKPYGGGATGTLQITYDVAKFLEQLKLEGKADSIVYDGTTYSWNAEKGTASKWYNSETSLVSAIIDDGVTALSGTSAEDGYYNLETALMINGHSISFTIKISEASVQAIHTIS